MQPPSTLDLTHHARLAIRHMIANHDPASGYPYFYINVHADPPSASHNAWDLIDVTARYVDSLILAREMTGDDYGRDLEQRYRDLLVASLDQADGLAYRPQTEWSLHEAEMFDQSRAMTALVTWYKAERDSAVARHISRLVEGLWNAAIHVAKRRAGYTFCWFPYASRFHDGWNPATPGEPCCYSGGALVLPLVECAEATGSERALELARRFVHYIVDESHIFRPDGSFWPDTMNIAAGHFHSRSLALAGILRFALLDDKPELVEWVRRAFDWAMTTSGSFGWFPEGVGTEDWYTTKHSETCSIADMIHIAAMLAESGRPEYWGHVERFTRNHLIESQWTREDWLKPADTAEREAANAEVMGGFAGRTLPWEFSADGFMMGCCCGAGPRALYTAWDRVVTTNDSGTAINLHLSRTGSAAEVVSWLPYEGRVDVHLKANGPLRIRLPDSDGPIALTRDGVECSYASARGYAVVADAQPGERFSLHFAVATRECEEALLGWKLKLAWRGDTVVSMEPRGSRHPLYEGRG